MAVGTHQGARHSPAALKLSGAVAQIFMCHIAALLILPSFVLLAATYVQGNQIKAKLHYPMVPGTKVWALAPLLANGSLARDVLFGNFLLWSVVLFAASRRRDLREQIVYPAGTAGMSAVTVVSGIAAWAVFALWLHRVLIGVSPFSVMGSTG